MGPKRKKGLIVCVRTPKKRRKKGKVNGENQLTEDCTGGGSAPKGGLKACSADPKWEGSVRKREKGGDQGGGGENYPI